MTPQDFENILKTIYANLEYDGYGYWLPEWCVSEDTTNKQEKPPFEEFMKAIKERI